MIGFIRKFGCVAALLGVSGCAIPYGGDSFIRNGSILNPGPGGFQFITTAADHDGYGQDNPVAEAKRMSWLKYHLDLNHLCPDGFMITDRQIVVVNSANQRVTYKGTCN